VPGTVEPVGPGRLTRTLGVPGGRTRVWLRMSGGRKLTVAVDGQEVGHAQHVNTPGQWVPVGALDLEAGDHRIEVSRGGITLAPGDGFRGELGPVALEPVSAPRLVSTTPSAYRALCGRAWDWIELVENHP
jgi:hypothetical protein